MNIVTKENLKRFAPKIEADDADQIAHFFNLYADQYGVNKPVRIHFFLSNAAHETGGFTRFEENLNYSAERLLQVFPKYFTPAKANAYARIPIKIANRVYAGRYGNGDEASGDGWRYRGRGIYQLTFKDNYFQATHDIYGDSSTYLVDNPDEVAKPELAVRTALNYWLRRNLSALADAGDFKAVVKGINGGLNGLDDREEWLAKAQAIFL